VGCSSPFLKPRDKALDKLLQSVTHGQCNARPTVTSQVRAAPAFTAPCKKASAYSITKRRVPELIPVLGSQPAGDVSHKPDSRLPLLSARPAVTRRNP